MEKDPRVYVRHILEAIANIEADPAGYDFERFRLDRRARQLVERNLEILSEARRPTRSPLAKTLSAAFFTAALGSNVIECWTALPWSGKEVESDHL